MQFDLFPPPGDELGDAESWCIQRGYSWIIGVDEAGRGPLAGPVYTAAVALDLSCLDEDWLSHLNDSKKLDEDSRRAARDLIEEHAVAFAVDWADPKRIDEINILQATLKSMKSAVDAVVQMLDEPVDHVLIDGNQRIETELEQLTLVKGDGRSLAIAAASILAKVGRDELMLEYHDRWPEYGFNSNKGYGSQAHRDAIAEHGPCEIHRMTFGGVKEHAHRLRAD